MKRAIIIVLDSAGIGALPDAESYGDAGTNTLGHIAEAAFVVEQGPGAPFVADRDQQDQAGARALQAAAGE